MNNFLKKGCLIILGIILGFPSLAISQPYIPLSEVMPISKVNPGMTGTALTVIKGDTVVSFPVEVVSTVPRQGSPGNLILIRTKGPVVDKTGGIASGMSGSPVYIEGKLLGAIGYGWNFSRHDLGYVTPIEDMVSIWNWPEDLPSFRSPVSLEEPASDDKKPEDDSEKTITNKVPEDDVLIQELGVDNRSTPLFASGISRRSADSISEILGEDIEISGVSNSTMLPVEYNATLKPGEAVGVLLAWGDVSMGATGTLTSVSKDGRFIAFAHPFLNRGNVAYPLTRAWIHDVIPSIKSPFKVGTPQAIVGCVTQDRPQGIGGRIGVFLPSMDVSLKLEDTKSSLKGKKRFHLAHDPFLVSKIFPEVIIGVVDDLWGRRGEGTFKVDFEIEGGTLSKGWQRTDYFFSETDVAAGVAENIRDLTSMIVLNPFRKINPLGVNINLQVTSEPRVLYIDGLSVDKKKVKPGDSLKVEVTLMPYRKEHVKKEFSLTIPEDAFGPCEIIVRGGGIAPLEQESISRGLETISSFPQLLEELSARETNNEVIIELLCNKQPEFGNGIIEDEKDFELLSEVKKRRMKEGTLRIFKSNYYVDGLLRKTVTVIPGALESGNLR